MAGQAYSSPVNFVIPAIAPDGIKDPAVQLAVSQMYNAFQQIIFTFINYCGIGPQAANIWPQLEGVASTLLRNNMNRYYAPAVETIGYGALISLVNAGGIAAARNANAANHLHWADGFCNVVGGLTSGQFGEFILKSGILPIVGATPAQRYWLATAAGLITTAPSTGAGLTEQYIGIAINSGSILMDIAPGINH